MGVFPRRDLRAEAHKHFHGNAEQRILTALRLGQEALDLYLTRLPAGTTRAEARRAMQRNTHRGRVPSAVTGAGAE